MAKKAIQAAIPLIALATVVAATQSETGFMLAHPDAVADLISAGHAELNTGAAPNEKGELPVRATPEGIAALDSTENNTNEDGGSGDGGSGMTFEIETSAAINKPTRGATKTNKYPFDMLPAPTKNEAGLTITGKFFVPSTAEMPDPVKSLGSTVSDASARHSTITGYKEAKYPKKDANGNVIEGQFEIRKRAEREYTRKFRVVAGVKTGPDGKDIKGAYVERTL